MRHILNPKRKNAVLVLHFFFCFMISLNAQTFADLGQNEFQNSPARYDASCNCFETIVSSTPAFYQSADSNMVFVRLRYDTIGQVIDSNRISFLNNFNAKYPFSIDAVDGSETMVLVRFADFTRCHPQSTSGVPQCLSSAYLSQWDNDSVILLDNVATDSAYGLKILGHQKIGDSLFFVTEYYSGLKDTAKNLYFTSIYLPDGSKKTKILNLKIGMTDLGLGRFRRDQNSNDWFAVGILQNTFTPLICRLNAGMQFVKSFDNLSFIPLNGFTNIWQTNKEIYVYTTGAVITPKASSNILMTYAIEVFDKNQDSITARHFYNFSPDSTGWEANLAGFDSYFDGERFVLTGVSDTDPSLAGRRLKTVLFEVDTSFTIKKALEISDSTSNYRGSITRLLKVSQFPSKIFYFGTVNSSILTGSAGFNLMFGEFVINDSSISTADYVFHKANMYLYPNPSKGKLNLLWDGEDFKPYPVKVYDVNGRLVFQAQIKNAREKLDLKLPAGQYFLEAREGRFAETQSFIVE